MDEFRLKVFVTAAQTLNFSHCAKLMGITQPAVSSHIKELEGHYGQKLFERNTSGLELTDFGHFLCEKAQNILSEYSKLEYEAFFMIHAGELEDYQLAASYHAARELIPHAMKRYLQLVGRSISIKVGSQEEVRQWVESSQVRIGVLDCEIIRCEDIRPEDQYMIMLLDDIARGAVTSECV